ncbi:MAG TPA: hypothetical protein VFZ53_11710 [Polyangiaceae bacterium]
MSVSISEILAGASAHTVPLAGECAGYLVLAAADQAVVAPRRIGPREVHLEDDGSVRVDGARAAAECDSEGDLRALLDALLLNASSATPALLRASRRAPGRGIAALVREIETALIPVNRAAAHRALARLERETERARERGRLGELLESLPGRNEVRQTPPPVAVTSAPPTPPPPSVAAALPPAVEAVSEIPSLFAPPVEPVGAESPPCPVEIETRPEPIVARRSSKPPPLPRTPSPPPLPIAEARSTPFFGTLVSGAFDVPDDEMEIEVVVDENELIDDELTSVLVRAEPLAVSAMTEALATPEPTDPCLPALEDEATDPEHTRALEEFEEPLFQSAELEPIAEEPVLAEPIAVEPIAAEPEHTVLLETRGETMALALAMEPIVPEPPPVPRVPMPQPRPSDVDELLGRMAPAAEGAREAAVDVRTSLKSLAGLEPTPNPPET